MRRIDRVAALEARRQAAASYGPDEDLFRHLPRWWRALTDDELAEIAAMHGTTADKRRYREIEACCRARPLVTAT